MKSLKKSRGQTVDTSCILKSGKGLGLWLSGCVAGVKASLAIFRSLFCAPASIKDVTGYVTHDLLQQEEK